MSKVILILITLSILSLSPTNFFGQDFNIINHYAVSNTALPSNHISSVASDEDGNLWIGTNSGLTRFDGKNWNYLTNINERLESKSITHIVVEKGNIIWLATKKEIGKYDSQDFKSISLRVIDLPDASVSALVIDLNGILWVGTNNRGLIRFDGVIWKFFNTSNSKLLSNFITSLCTDSKGNIFVGNNTGHLTKFDGNKWKVYKNVIDKARYPYIKSISLDKNENNIWISTTSDLVKFDGKKWEFFNIDYKFSFVRGLRREYADIEFHFCDRNGNIWVSTSNGLIKFDENLNSVLFNTSNSNIPYNCPDLIAEDNNDNILIALGHDGGLAKFDGKNWISFNTSNTGLPSNSILNITIDKNGIKWIGTRYNGLARFDGENWIVYNRSNSDYIDNNITAIFLDDKNNLWVAMYPMQNQNNINLIKITDGNIANVIPIELPINWKRHYTNWIECIYVDEGENKYLGTFRSGVIQLDINNNLKKLEKLSGEYNIYNSFYDESKKIIYYATSDGIAKIDLNTGVDYAPKFPIVFDHLQVYNLCKDPKGFLWAVIQDRGLFKINQTENNIVYNVSHPFRQKAGSSIMQKGANSMILYNNNMWISTGNELAKFDGENWSVFDFKFLEVSYCDILTIESNNILWLGTNKGVYVVEYLGN